jgi:hypothetical protein
LLLYGYDYCMYFAPLLIARETVGYVTKGDTVTMVYFSGTKLRKYTLIIPLNSRQSSQKLKFWELLYFILYKFQAK